MAQITKRITDITAVDANAIVTANIPTGMSVHHCGFTVAPDNQAALDSINDVRVLANGKVIMQFANANQVDVLNRFNGRDGFVDNGGVLYIDFDMRNLRNRVDEWVTALGTGNVMDPATGKPMVNPHRIDDLKIEFQLAADSPITKISGYGMYNTINKVNTVIKTVRQFTENIAAGVNTFNLTPPKSDIYKQILFDWRERGNTAAIDNIQMFIENKMVFDRTVATNTAEQEDGYRIPQTGWFIIDPTENGYGNEGIVTVRDNAAVNDWYIQVMTTNAALTGNLPYYTVSWAAPEV